MEEDSFVQQKPPGKMKSWMLRQMEGRLAATWLFVISFLESSFFPVPPDFFLLPVVIRKPERWKFFSVIVSIGSVIGGIAGYAIGAWFFSAFGERIVSFYQLEAEMAYVGTLFDKNAFWAIFTAAFTPIPYKLFTIAAGLFKIDLFTFIIASILGRSMRFFVVGYISKMFGQKMGYLIFKYFNWFTAAFAVVIAIFLLLEIVR